MFWVLTISYFKNIDDSNNSNNNQKHTQVVIETSRYWLPIYTIKESWSIVTWENPSSQGYSGKMEQILAGIFKDTGAIWKYFDRASILSSFQKNFCEWTTHCEWKTVTANDMPDYIAHFREGVVVSIKNLSWVDTKTRNALYSDFQPSKKDAFYTVEHILKPYLPWVGPWDSYGKVYDVTHLMGFANADKKRAVVFLWWQFFPWTVGIRVLLLKGEYLLGTTYLYDNIPQQWIDAFNQYFDRKFQAWQKNLEDDFVQYVSTDTEFQTYTKQLLEKIEKILEFK